MFKAKELVVRMMGQRALWQDCGDGSQTLETTLRLSGWTRDRRVVFIPESPQEPASPELASLVVAKIGAKAWTRKPPRGVEKISSSPPR